MRCVLDGAGLAGGVVKRGGEARHLTLTSYDLYGNRCTQGGAQVTLSLQPRDAVDGAAAGAAGAAAGAVAGSVTDAGDGTYNLTYKALPGAWVLSVLLGSSLVPPSPLVIVNVRDPAEEAEARRKEEAERARAEAAAEEARRREAEAAAAAAAAREAEEAAAAAAEAIRAAARAEAARVKKEQRG